MSCVVWHALEGVDLEVGQVAPTVAGGRGVCVARTASGLAALDNRCPHQGGPLGEGTIEDGWLICPWHGYEFDPVTGEPPDGYDDAATPFPIEDREGVTVVGLPVTDAAPSLMDQMVDVMVDWGIDTVFGMVGHSNLGLADALRSAEEDGRLRYYGIRHEGAAAFAASAYGKLTARPAACFTIAGPGATNLLTGLWDANVDRAPVVALTGQVNTQVLGPGAFQEVPLSRAFEAVASWSQTVMARGNATELMALAVKHATIDRSVAHLIFPDEVQNLGGLSDPPARPVEAGSRQPRSVHPKATCFRPHRCLQRPTGPSSSQGTALGSTGRRSSASPRRTMSRSSRPSRRKASSVTTIRWRAAHSGGRARALLRPP